MYRSFRARNFRCFADLQVSNLARINLFAGLNNVGKTALLEALFIHSSAQDPRAALEVDVFRGMSGGEESSSVRTREPWTSLFAGSKTGTPVELTGELSTGKTRTLRLRPVDDPEELAKPAQMLPGEFARPAGSGPPPAVLAADLEDDGERLGTSYLGVTKFGNGLWSVGLRLPEQPPTIFLVARKRPEPSEDAERYGKMEVNGQQDMVRDALKVIEPRLQRLAAVPLAGAVVIHGDIGLGRLVPLPLMGDGMVRLLSFIVGIGNAPKGVALVDEIENGLHHSVLPNVWRVVAEAARQFDVQVFATTHSIECIEAATRAFEADLGFEDDFRLHRLERVNGTIVAQTGNREAVRAALEMGLEVR